MKRFVHAVIILAKPVMVKNIINVPRVKNLIYLNPNVFNNVLKDILQTLI